MSWRLWFPWRERGPSAAPPHDDSDDWDRFIPLPDNEPVRYTVANRQAVDARDDLLVTLHLYATEFMWRKLTNEQRNLWADVVDAHRAREYPDDHTPMERWWND